MIDVQYVVRLLLVISEFDTIFPVAYSDCFWIFLCFWFAIWIFLISLISGNLWSVGIWYFLKNYREFINELYSQIIYRVTHLKNWWQSRNSQMRHPVYIFISKNTQVKHYFKWICSFIMKTMYSSMWNMNHSVLSNINFYFAKEYSM